MRVMPALVDTVSSLAMQKVMAERRIAVQSLRDLEEGLPLSSILLRQVAINRRTSGQCGQAESTGGALPTGVLTVPHPCSTCLL
jgi:hypothetical protein